MKKKIIVIIASILLVLTITIIIIMIIKSITKKNPELEGKWTSVDKTIIKIIKEYKDGKPIYANDNIIKYIINIKNDNTYILYVNDPIESNILEQGKYNIKSKSIIYFNPDKNTKVSSYIWTCKIDNKKIHDCSNYAEIFER